MSDKLSLNEAAKPFLKLCEDYGDATPLPARIIAEQARRLEVAKEALEFYAKPLIIENDKLRIFIDVHPLAKDALETLNSKEPCV